MNVAMTSTYYNENDAYPAQWLRNLISAGHITPGVVDERSIKDVQPEDLDGYERAHFFAGIGGWDLALQLAGWPADRFVWTGSCPCQPFSSASRGRARGTADERHLWPKWGRLIGKCRPATVFGEQVATGGGPNWLDAVADDFEGMGYAFGAARLCASIVGLPKRDRFFFVAHSDSESKRARTVDAKMASISSAATMVDTNGRAVSGLGSSRYEISSNMGRLRAYGNAIVPQIAATFIRVFMETDQ